MTVRFPPLSKDAVAIRVAEELTEIKEEEVNSTCGERNLEQIERSMKTFSSCGLLSAHDANEMQTVIEKICQMNLVSSLQWSIGNIPSSPTKQGDLCTAVQGMDHRV